MSHSSHNSSGADDEWAQLTAQSFNCTRNHCNPSSESMRACQQAIHAGSASYKCSRFARPRCSMAGEGDGAPPSPVKKGKPYLDDVRGR
ncbi:hypothetical protein AN403_5792 [Pseudomonas fluorescens]|uniref:Uncharacterized protein n=1 Tax=Pseudomonas fluorescens TaxID=294 RepID=A0A0P8X6C6_PSEFL|nr:hypothetical protein AN403_5792 [Pseudomonas fluorescens]